MPQQTAFEMVSLEGLVPKDHLLRKIEAVIDFSFIHDRVAGLYCPDNGRPPLDPMLMFKALFVGYLFGIRSERQLLREIEVNVAYRWFLGLQLTEPVFDASTLSQNRRRRFDGTTVAQDIFDAIVEQAIAKGLVDGTVLYTDSTHLKANANKNRYDLAVIAKSRADYWDALDAAIDQDREAHDKPPLKPKPRNDDPRLLWSRLHGLPSQERRFFPARLNSRHCELKGPLPWGGFFSATFTVEDFGGTNKFKCHGDDAMSIGALDELSLDDLWDLHGRVCLLLEQRLENEKRKLQARLDELGRKFGGTPADIPQRRPYAKVEPKFRNPEDASVTWSGRGKQPRWLTELRDRQGS